MMLSRWDTRLYVFALPSPPSWRLKPRPPPGEFDERGRPPVEKQAPPPPPPLSRLPPRNRHDPVIGRPFAGDRGFGPWSMARGTFWVFFSYFCGWGDGGGESRNTLKQLPPGGNPAPALSNRGKREKYIGPPYPPSPPPPGGLSFRVCDSHDGPPAPNHAVIIRDSFRAQLSPPPPCSEDASVWVGGGG